MEMRAHEPDVAPGRTEPAPTDPGEVGQRLRENLEAAGVTLLNGGVPPDPAKIRRVAIPIGTAATSLIGELSGLPADAMFAEASGDADIVAVFFTGLASGGNRAAG